MKKVIIFLIFFIQVSFLGAQSLKVDTIEINKIRNEAFNNSMAMENLKTFCYLYGGRLMWSPEYKKSAEWISAKLKEWEIPIVYYEDINRSGKSWSLKKFYANIVEPYTMPIIGNPKEWTPGTNGIVRAEVIYLNVKTDADFEKYKGKLKGKIVCLFDPIPARIGTLPWVTRFSDDSLKSMSDFTITDSIEKIKAKEVEERNSEAYMQYFNFIAKKVEFCMNEEAALIVDPGLRLYGLNQVWANTAAIQSKDIFDYLSKNAGDPEVPESIPQITISTEQYNALVGAIERGAKVEMEAVIEVEKGGVEKGFNLIAEIPGTDLKNEIVVIGGHLDSYSYANGTVDNGTGVIACMEALRIIKTLGLQPRRTIRIGLWGAEEEGLFGSKAHIEKHFKFGKEKCYAYFNMDLGVGRFRGIYAQENKSAANLFKEWMSLLNDPKFQTVCISIVKNSDHEAFHDAGLPGFQFIQDLLDYFRIYHTNMDFIERIPKDDLINDAYIMTAFAWLAANRVGDFPNK
ncbi:MAG: M20/M25/M40 family metallo-hydrolase [Ignavibacteria bacterium]|jgi:hypothetical protein